MLKAIAQHFHGNEMQTTNFEYTVTATASTTAQKNYLTLQTNHQPYGFLSVTAS